jgi:Tfp pilus assembly protein PilE
MDKEEVIMLKNNRGITMIALVITVIVLIILASITTYSGVSTIRESRFYKAISEMKVMQAAVNEWYEDYKSGDSSIWDKGVSLNSSGKNEQITKAYNSAKTNNLNGTDIGDITGYKFYSSNLIVDDLDIDGISYDFIINIETRNVILVDGIERKGVTYYSLNEIEEEQYNVGYVEDLICALVDDMGTSSTIYIYNNSDVVKDQMISISIDDKEIRTNFCCRR